MIQPGYRAAALFSGFRSSSDMRRHLIDLQTGGLALEGQLATLEVYGV